MKKLLFATGIILAIAGFGSSAIVNSYNPPMQTHWSTIAAPVNYPAFLANAPLDQFVDRWGSYNRECTSYAAWKVQSTFHNMPNWTSYTVAPNASLWPTLAKGAGIATGSIPRAYSVAIAMPGVDLGNGLVAGQYGHAMWVESVNGNTVHVSQYNLRDDGAYSESDTPAQGLIYIYFGS